MVFNWTDFRGEPVRSRKDAMTEGGPLIRRAVSPQYLGAILNSRAWLRSTSRRRIRRNSASSCDSLKSHDFSYVHNRVAVRGRVRVLSELADMAAVSIEGQWSANFEKTQNRPLFRLIDF